MTKHCIIFMSILLTTLPLFSSNKINQPFFYCDREGEFLVDTNVVSVPGIGKQHEPAIAFDGTNFLLVWTDLRNRKPEIRGARIDTQGSVLDTLTIPIATQNPSYGPAVAFGGTNFLIVWLENHRLNITGYEEWFTEIYGARVGLDGTLIDRIPLRITPRVYCHMRYSYPHIAFDGQNYLVMWGRVQGLWGTRVTPDGVVLDPSSIHISDGNYLLDPSISFGDSLYLLVWLDGNSIKGSRVEPSGVVLDTIEISSVLPPEELRYPSAAFDGTNFLVTWQHRDSFSRSKILGARVSESGTLIDTTAFRISDDTTGHSMNPTVAFDGNSYWVAWYCYGLRGCDIFASQVSPADPMQNYADIRITNTWGDQRMPVITFGDTNYLIAWENITPLMPIGAEKYFHDIFTTTITPTGSIDDSIGQNIGVISPGHQYSSVAAFDGTNYLVVWQDYHHDSIGFSSSTIYGTRVSSTGTVIDAQPFPIGAFWPDTLFAYRWDMKYPDIIFGNNNYLVVWNEQVRDYGQGTYALDDIYGARITPDAQVLDPEGFLISDSLLNDFCNDPAVTYDGTNYFVFWKTCALQNGIFGRRINESGVFIDTNAILIAEVSVPWVIQEGLAVASNGMDHFVVWAGAGDIHGARVSSFNGSVISPSPVSISTAMKIQCCPDVAFDGTNYFVVWEDYRYNHIWWRTDTVTIFGTRVTQNGIVLDPEGINISELHGINTSPQITFNGTDYVVMWEYYNDPYLPSDFNHDIMGATVNPMGNVIDRYIVASQCRDQCEPSLTKGPGEQILLTYTGWVQALNDKQVHAMRIWGKLSPFVGTEEKDKHQTVRALALDIYPNPFRRTVTIDFAIPSGIEKKEYTVSIYDITGRLVRTYPNITSDDIKTIRWNGVDEQGRMVSAGVYCCRLIVDDETTVSKKMIFLK